MNISERIKARRLELGLSVDAIAEKLHINRATYYRYESNEIEKFPLESVLPLSEILKLPPEIIMGWNKEEQTEPQNTPAALPVDDLTPDEVEELKSYKQFIINKRDIKNGGA